MSIMPVLVESSTVFVGRGRELHFLRDHVRRSHAQTPGMVLVSGDAGVGKTRLVSEFVSTLPAGTVFVGGCLQLGVDGLAYAPFTAVLRQLLRERGHEAFTCAAPGGVGELARLLPELGEVSEHRPENRGLLFEQVLRLLSHTAEDHGLTVVLEDLHWSDGATRDLLVFLLRNLDLPGVHILATYRSDDLHRSHPLRRLLPELRRMPHVESLELGPLSREEAGAQAAAIRGTALRPHELDDLYQRTEGVPLFVESLAASAGPPSVDDGGEVPDQFRDLLLEPLHRFDDTALSVLRVASVGAVSGSIEHEMLRHAVDLSEPELEAALHTLVDANVLRTDRTGYRFRHSLLRDAVHGELLPGPHARLHLRFAHLIDAHPDSVPFDRRAAEQAHHYNAAQELPSALEAAWWAAVRAGDTLAYGEELGMLERVLALWDRVPDARERVQGRTRAEVGSRAAGAALEAGLGRRAVELADEALATLPEDDHGEHTLAVRAGLLRRRGQARADHSRGGIRDLVTALELHPPHSPGYCLLLSSLARESMLHRADRRPGPDQERLRALARSGRSARGLAEEAIARADPSRAEDMCAVADARITLGALYMDADDPGRGRPLIEAAIAHAVEIGDPSLEARGASNLGNFLRELGQHEEALAVLEESLARHEARGWMPGHKISHQQNRAEVHFELGDLDTARAICEEAARAQWRSRHRCYTEGLLVRTAAAQGDLDTAREVAETPEHVNAVESQRMNTVQLSLLGLLETHLASGAVEEALTLAENTLERLALESAPGYLWPMADTLSEAARLGADPGGPGPRVERARRVRGLIADLVSSEPAHGTAQRAYRASVYACLAEVDGAEHAVLLERWTTAVRAWEATPMRLHLTRARLRAAEAAAAAGRRGPALEGVRRAHAVARECGAAPLAAAAADLARRMGAGLEEEASPPAAPAGLTPRESEVLRLLATGGTNAQIAERLFITPKTASVHVSNILAKLEVPNRAAAGARARELGLA